MSAFPLERLTPFGGEDDLKASLAEHTEDPTTWEQPGIYDVSVQSEANDLKRLVDTGRVAVRNPIKEIATELFEYEQPGLKNNDMVREAYVAGIEAMGPRFGKWVHFPWLKSVVHYPDQEQHRALRTSRNRPLITEEEQAQLYDAKVAVFGLSVGSNVVEKLVSSGIGGTIIMGDPDRISPTNLNRITGGFQDVGKRKLDHMAQKISEADPYIKQVHLPEGFTPAATDTLIENRPSIIFDEVDNLQAKAQMREYAKQHRIPLVMVTDLGDRSLVDVERHDLEDVKPFGGRVKQKDYEALLDGTLPEEQRMKMMTRIVGMRHITTRMLESAVQIDKEISGLPQLGVTASTGAGLGAIAAREIILGRQLASDRYVLSPKQTMELQPQGTIRQYFSAARNLLASMKAGKERAAQQIAA